MCSTEAKRVISFCFWWDCFFSLVCFNFCFAWFGFSLFCRPFAVHLEHGFLSCCWGTAGKFIREATEMHLFFIGQTSCLSHAFNWSEMNVEKASQQKSEGMVRWDEMLAQHQITHKRSKSNLVAADKMWLRHVGRKLLFVATRAERI